MLIVDLILSFAICFAALPAVIRLSWRIGAVDVPRDWRRMHQKSTPRAGGIAIYVSFFLVCSKAMGGTLVIRCIMGAGVLMLLLGVCDDVLTLDAWVKLFFQAAIALAAAVGCGITRPIGLILATFWVVMLANAHNMIDGLDGLFTGCASIEGVALAAALWMSGAFAHAQAAVCLAGACMAFLCFNKHPARIFAGDCGSGTVGLLYGLLSLPLWMEADAIGNPLSVLLLFGYPLTDLLAAVIRRLLQGKSPFAADRAHLHHRVCAAGASIWACALVFWSITLVISVLGVLLLKPAFLPLASLLCMGIALLLVGLRRFILKFS